jgi:hypothetical protein
MAIQPPVIAPHSHGDSIAVSTRLKQTSTEGASGSPTENERRLKSLRRWPLGGYDPVVEDIAPVAFRGRIVRFKPRGKRRQWRVVVVESGEAIRTAEQQGIADAMLVARIQSLAHAWGLSARLVSSDDFAMVFEIAMAG